ncbi:MAG: cupredoxin domain-containing protein [bacterium]|nr:cupredoxin domain-containing protein [bacterium]
MQIIGIILIIFVGALFLLWIFFTKHKKGILPAEVRGVQTVNILVKGAYSPSVIRAKAGKPLHLIFTREESSDCSRFVNFSDFRIRKELPQGEPVAVDITPVKKGTFIFNCDMSMYQGKLIIE